MWAPAEWEADFVSLEARDASRPYHCPSYRLPALGVIEISPGNTINLTEDAVFRPQCLNTNNAAQTGSPDDGTGGLTSIADIRDPFHASITPQAYATGAATVIAWMLVIMLIITPRTFFVGNASGRSGLMGRRGMIGGASGSGSIIGVGSRPWLQKAAALTVAISLTLATADTFKIAGRQYEEGFIDAKELRDQVVAGMEIKVSRVISDIFLWLAQVQTLIRLFPRHKEKVIIKWVGFALILLDITFSSLNSFGPYETQRRPAHFDSAIPALSYLFQLSLSMLYAAWVMYYAITKRRYAFYHSMMWNMSVVALLSIVAILTPVVFFITDIANYTIAGWGDYFRWVGAAAASVIVWEWVERIEALEREEKKDGILGREIYDGDDMLDNTTTSSKGWPSKRGSQDSGKDEKRGGSRGGFSAFASEHSGRFHDLTQKLGRKMTESPRAEARKKRTIHVPAPAPVLRRSESANRVNRDSRNYQRVSSPPPVPVVSSPVSRTDTTSADSTVYTVRYHPISETPPNPQAGPTGVRDTNVASQSQQQPSNQDTPGQPANPEDPEKGAAMPDPVICRSKWQWQAVGNAFKRKGRTPPQELQRGRVIEPLGVEDVTANIPPRSYNGWALTDRLGTLAAQSGDRFRSRKKSASQLETNLPVTIIPAQPRGQTWSPDFLQQQQPSQQEDVATNSGANLARVPTAIEEEEPMASPAQSGEGTNSSQIAHASSTPTSHRNQHIRFRADTSRSWQRSTPAATGVLGTEVRQSQAADSSLPPPDETTATMDFSVAHSQNRTDHDR